MRMKNARIVRYGHFFMDHYQSVTGSVNQADHH